MENLKLYIEYTAKTIEAIGVLSIFIGLMYSLFVFFAAIYKKKTSAYKNLRQTLGKSILLGLEILIAADIIATVSTKPSMRSVTILGVIVLIRTFLSLSLQVELEGRFPWQKYKTKDQ